MTRSAIAQSSVAPAALRSVRLGAVDHGVGAAAFAHHPPLRIERGGVGRAVGLGAAHEPLQRGPLESLHEVDDVAAVAAASGCVDARIAADVVVGRPVGRIGGDLLREGEPLRLARPAVEPEHRVDLVPAAGAGPAALLLERDGLQLRGLVGVVLREERRHARVARGVRPIAQVPLRDHVRPPVVLAGAEVAVRPLGREGRVDPALRLLLERRVVEREREGDEAARVVGTSLPGELAPAAGVRHPVRLADVGIELLGVAGEAVALPLQRLLQVAFGADRAGRQALHRGGTEAGAPGRGARGEDGGQDQMLLHAAILPYPAGTVRKRKPARGSPAQVSVLRCEGASA